MCECPGGNREMVQAQAPQVLRQKHLCNQNLDDDVFVYLKMHFVTFLISHTIFKVKTLNMPKELYVVEQIL